MDMMGGVLEVKKEDILRMVRFLAILMEGGMGWSELLKHDHFFYVNLNFRNSTAINTPPPVPHKGFPGGSDSKESACNAGYPDSIPKSGRSPGEGNATHSSTLAWRILWTEEPGRL